MNYSIDWDGPGERDREEMTMRIDYSKAAVRAQEIVAFHRALRGRSDNLDLAEAFQVYKTALSDLLLVCGRTGDAMTDFEEQAAAFHRETGWMRPGKDMPAAGSDERTNHEMRWERYSTWVQSKIQAARDVLSKPEDGDDG